MNYIIGLDIGIASVGWAVLDIENKRIADLGVRTFSGAEDAKTGASLAAPRRIARSTRRRLRRKRQRMTEIRHLIVKKGILPQSEMDSLFLEPHEKTPWELRAEGLDRLLSHEEWARTLLHIAKHRGFQSNRKDIKDDIKSEEGKAKAGMRENAELLAGDGGGMRYRTVGEMVQLDPKFTEHKRNKNGEYTHTLKRVDIQNEVKTLFASQHCFGNEFADEAFESSFIEIFLRQLPFSFGDTIEKMIGKCTLEPECLRAPKNSYTGERFVLYSNLARMLIFDNGEKKTLQKEERDTIAALAYKNKKLTFTQIRKALNKDKAWSFANCLPKTKDSKDPESGVFIEMKGWHAIKKAVSEKLGEEYWETNVAKYPEKLDSIACALTYRKADNEIMEYLEKEGIEKDLANAVLSVSFSQCLKLSLKAIKKLLPFIEEEGMMYDRACTEAGYCHYSPGPEKKRSLKLPVPDWNEIRNPVVIRAISEVRKVVNAITLKYGNPARVHVELAREMSLSKDDRDEIGKEQLENKNKKEATIKAYEQEFHVSPSLKQIEKYRLWKDQGGYCPYSGRYIDPALAFCGEDGNYAEIDHIIPYSRSFDDSYTNKVLVFGSENRNKGNKTPYEYFGKEGPKWESFKIRADNYCKNNRKKISKLQRKDINEKEENEMKERSLGDTRYITKYAASWIEENMLFADTETKRPVTRLNGRATAMLRWQWGLNALKDRTKNDLHHALDAAVVAAATPAIIQQMSLYSQKKELCRLKQEIPEGQKTHFPEPWKLFRKEIEARLAENPNEKIKEFGLTNYPDAFLCEIKPVMTSRRPERGAHGQAHEATIRSAKYIKKTYVNGICGTTTKTPLSKINKAKLENMVGKDRDTALYEALKRRLEENNDKPAIAFKDDFIKPTKNGTQGPLVRSIKIFDTGVSGLQVCGGIASNVSMVRVDVYSKDGKYFIIPFYVGDVAKKIHKNRAISANKPENDWVKVDSSYKFLFSFFKNDLIKVVDRGNKVIFGYYQGCDRSTGAFEIMVPNGKITNRGIGMRTAKLVEKYQVGILGDYYKVRKEKPPYELA